MGTEKKAYISSGNTDQSDQSPKAKGQRLRKARKATYLGLPAFAEKHKLNQGTLKSWEQGLHGGLPAKRAPEIINALELEGIKCSYEWLMYGIGEPISKTKGNIIPTQKIGLSATKMEENKLIAQEIEYFHQIYEKATSLVVTDDALSPHYQLGDIVAGIKQYGNDIKKLLDLDCIIQIIDIEKPILRKLCQGKSKNHYTLVSTNPSTTAKPSVLYDINIVSAAPVIWIRRKKDYYLCPKN